MSQKFNFDTGVKLSNALTAVAEELQTKNKDMQDRYNNLNETFKDPVYQEFKAEFSACDRSILAACELLKELSSAVFKYADSLREIV